MTSDLKPCPLCGGTTMFKEYKPTVSGVAICTECGARSPICRGDHTGGWRVHAADAWNRRAERTCRVGCYPPGYEDNLHYEVCSECGTILTASRPGDRHAARASYCPRCGARVVDE